MAVTVSRRWAMRWIAIPIGFLAVTCILLWEVLWDAARDFWRSFVELCRSVADDWRNA